MLVRHANLVIIWSRHTAVQQALRFYKELLVKLVVIAVTILFLIFVLVKNFEIKISMLS